MQDTGSKRSEVENRIPKSTSGRDERHHESSSQDIARATRRENPPKSTPQGADTKATWKTRGPFVDCVAASAGSSIPHQNVDPILVRKLDSEGYKHKNSLTAQPPQANYEKVRC